MDSLAVPLLPERPTETPAYALVLLATTIVIEVSATLFMRMTVYDARNYILYVASLSLFSWTLRCIPISVAYTTWRAFGTSGVSVASSVLFHEVIGVRRWVCILLTIPPVIGTYILPRCRASGR